LVARPIQEPGERFIGVQQHAVFRAGNDQGERVRIERLAETLFRLDQRQLGDLAARNVPRDPEYRLNRSGGIAEGNGMGLEPAAFPLEADDFELEGNGPSRHYALVQLRERGAVFGRDEINDGSSPQDLDVVSF